MNRIKTIACSLLLLTMPTMNSVSSAQASRPSSKVCDSYARDYAHNGSRQGQVLGRGAAGSLLGAGIGAIAGAAGVGAAVGAGIGMISGGAKRQSDAQRLYTVAYQDCMAGRVR